MEHVILVHSAGKSGRKGTFGSIAFFPIGTFWIEDSFSIINCFASFTPFLDLLSFTAMPNFTVQPKGWVLRETSNETSFPKV